MKNNQNNHRGNYTYHLIGTIQGKTLRRNAKYTQHFYQLSLSCESNPQITKIFAFKSKLANPQVWKELEAHRYFGQRFHLLCKNYQGYYYLVNWEQLSSKHQAPTENQTKDHEPN